MVNSKYCEKLEEIKDYALENNIPIMQDDGIAFLKEFIYNHNIKSILEIGTAIGYSAIIMSLIKENIRITSIERDETRYLEAVKNIKKFKLEDRITLIYGDALDIEISDNFDLIFIDAAKSQNINFFNKYSNNLNSKGFIITDNMIFHGYVYKKLDEIKSRNIRGLVRKINQYKVFLENNEKYNTEFLKIGDGIAVSQSKK